MTVTIFCIVSSRERGQLPHTSKLQNLVYPDGILFDKHLGSYRTENENEVFRIFRSISTNYKVEKEKAAKENAPLSPCVGMRRPLAQSHSSLSPLFGRDEATRTPDPYVPNVVRYQLRYIPMLSAESGCKGTAFFSKNKQYGRKFNKNSTKRMLLADLILFESTLYSSSVRLLRCMELLPFSRMSCWRGCCSLRSCFTSSVVLNLRKGLSVRPNSSPTSHTCCKPS